MWPRLYSKASEVSFAVSVSTDGDDIYFSVHSYFPSVSTDCFFFGLVASLAYVNAVRLYAVASDRTNHYHYCATARWAQNEIEKRTRRDKRNAHIL
jgi:hypothetical protein